MILDAGCNVHGGGRTSHSMQKLGDAQFVPGEPGDQLACSFFVRSTRTPDRQSFPVWKDVS